MLEQMPNTRERWVFYPLNINLKLKNQRNGQVLVVRILETRGLGITLVNTVYGIWTLCIGFNYLGTNISFVHFISKTTFQVPRETYETGIWSCFVSQIKILLGMRMRTLES